MEAIDIAKSYDMCLPEYANCNIVANTVTHIPINTLACFRLIDIINHDVEERTGITVSEVLSYTTILLTECIGNTIVNLGPEINVNMVIDFTKVLFINRLSSSNMDLCFNSEIFDTDSLIDEIIKGMWVDTFKVIFKTLGTEDILDFSALFNPEYNTDVYIMEKVISDSLIAIIYFKDEND